MNILFDGTQISNDIVTGLSYDSKMINDNDVFTLGETICNTIKLTVVKTEISQHPAVVTINNEEYVLDNVKEDETHYIYTLTDKMVNFNFRYDAQPLIEASSHTEPDGTKYVTLLELVEDMCSKANLSLITDDFVGYDKHITWYDNTVTAREYVGMVAELNGGYAIIDDGLVFKTIENGTKSVSGTNEFTIEDGIEGNLQVNVEGNVEERTSILPDGYTQVDYIQNSGTQYIDSLFYPNFSNGFKLEMTFEPTALGHRYCLMSNYAYEPQISCELNTSNQSRLYIQNGAVDNTLGTIISGKNKTIYEYSNGVWKHTVNGVESTGNYSISGTGEESLNIFVDKALRFSTFSYPLRVYSCRMYSGNEMVRDFVPCYRNNDNVIGLYDLINNVFYTNAGSGQFTKGSNTTLPNDEFPETEYPLIRMIDNVEINVKNKNYMPLSINEEFTIENSNSVEVDIKTGTYTFSFEDVEANNQSTSFLALCYYVDNSSKYVYVPKDEKETTIEFTKDVKRISLYAGSSAGSSNVATFKKYQIEKGTNKTEFVKYISLSETIDLQGNFIGKINNTKDELNIDSLGNIILTKKIGKEMGYYILPNPYKVNLGKLILNISNGLNYVKFKTTFDTTETITYNTNEPEYTLDIDDLQKYNLGEYHKITRVAIENGLFNPVGEESGTTIYINPNNVFITEQSEIDGIYNAINGFEYYSLEMEKGDLELLPTGICIALVDGNNIYKTYCQINVNYNGGWNGKYHFITGSNKQEETFVYEGIEDNYKRLKFELDTNKNEVNILIGQTNQLEEKTNKISTHIDNNGNITEVTTTRGFTFNADGLTITQSENSFKTLIDETGMYNYDGNLQLAEFTKNGAKIKDLDVYGYYRYGEDNITDEPLFIAVKYTNNNNEEGYGHFYNG